MSFVYFAEKDGLIKIGFSANPKVRMWGLGKPQLLDCMIGGKDLERRLHDGFSHARVRGEWFTPTMALREYIQAHIVPVSFPEPNTTTTNTWSFSKLLRGAG